MECGGLSPLLARQLAAGRSPMLELGAPTSRLDQSCDKPPHSKWRSGSKKVSCRFSSAVPQRRDPAPIGNCHGQYESPDRRRRPHHPPRSQGDARGGRPPDRQAQHRQPRPLRLRGARGDRRRRHPQPARCVRLLRLQGALLRPQGGDALLPAEGDLQRRHRGHLPRQRRLRADRHGHAGPVRSRRRGAGADARLPALDGGGEPLRRHGPSLHVRRAGGLAPGPRRHPQEDHPADPGHRPHQPQQPHRRALLARAARPDPGARPPAPAHRLRRRDLRQGRLRRAQARLDRLDGRRRPLPHLQRPLQELPRLRLPLRLDGRLRREAPRQGLHRGARHARLDAALRQRPRPDRHPDRAGRSAEHRGAGAAHRPPRPSARPRLVAPHRHPRRHLREAQGRALPVPPARRTSGRSSRGSGRCSCPR